MVAPRNGFPRALDLLYDYLDQKLASDGNVGTVTTSATTVASESGNDISHLTKLTMTNFSLGNLADNASLGIGNKFYTLPAGAYVVEGVTVEGGFTSTASVTAQTPEVAVGSVIASGAIANTTTTMEDYVDGGAAGLVGGDTVAPNLAGGQFYKGNLFTTPVLVKASGGKSHDLFLNAACAWADVTAAAPVLFTGVITLKWRKIN
jgi:hypothetical protein